MGTRSTVRIYSSHKKPRLLLAVNQHWGGYIEGVGHTLAKWLTTKTIVNGCGDGKSMENGHANGMECLAAQYVAEHKKQIGRFYCTTSNDVQEYNYEVRLINGTFNIKVYDSGNDEIFNGSPNELLDFEEQSEGDDDDNFLCEERGGC